MFILYFLIFTPQTYAIVNPLDSPNNKFGIHIITITSDELDPAQGLVNSSGGDWGYVTAIADSSHRDQNKWQSFFDKLRRRHLIPLVRLTTQPESDYWKRPYDGEEQAWADFLDNLNWPTKNRYVIIYNEPNSAHEWGNVVDPKNYAQTLDKTITALKNKNPDFFVLNAGLDASAPNKPPAYVDELTFLIQMNQAVPGIFNKLDGWASHSYPNPGFIGSPNSAGRGTIRTFSWEIQALRNLGLTKTLPIFITETGWKHSEGITLDQSLPTSDTVGQYFQNAFQNAWNDPQIVAVTPFLLNYQEAPFDHFSFKKYTGEIQKEKILGTSFPDYLPQYYSIQNIPKTNGQPVQEFQAKIIKGEVYPSLVAQKSYSIPLTFKNTGQSIWEDGNQISLIFLTGSQDFNYQTIQIPKNVKVEPGQDYTFNVSLLTPLDGNYPISINLFNGNIQFDNPPFKFQTQVKSPVRIQVQAKLGWKNNFAGSYIINAVSNLGRTVINLILNSQGISPEQTANDFLPDYTYNFTIQKPYYQSKTIIQTVHSGTNLLDFGTLQPDISSAILHPDILWHLLPFSN